MLANPVVVPAYASPLVWGFALLATWAEVGTALSMLRRMGKAAAALRPLLLINCMTWLAFLLAMDWCDRHGLWDGRQGVQVVRFAIVVATLELLVVIVEALLLRAMLRVVIGGGSRRALGLAQALQVSVVGNLVSIAVSLLVPMATFVLLR